VPIATTPALAFSSTTMLACTLAILTSLPPLSATMRILSTRVQQLTSFAMLHVFPVHEELDSPRRLSFVVFGLVKLRVRHLGLRIGLQTREALRRLDKTLFRALVCLEDFDDDGYTAWLTRMMCKGQFGTNGRRKQHCLTCTLSEYRWRHS